jgi:sugar lactone lactonase YvrE
MKPFTSRGSRPCWLYVFGLFLAVLGGFSPQSARAQVYPKEYIRVQPLSVIVQEGGAVGLDLEYAFGQDARDQTEVYWYRNGKLIGVSLPVLQTYVTPAGAFPKLWDPYVPPKGKMYENAADVATANLSDARAVWLATFNIPAVSANEAGMYYAKVGAVGTFYNWTYTNFAQVAMVPTDPSQSMEIVRNPLSKSLSAPASNPAPAIKLYGDMRSHISPILHTPFGTATDPEGFTFVADTLNHCIRKVSPGGHVTTLAGMDGQPYSYFEPSQYDPLKRDARTRKERDPVPGFRAGVTNQAVVPGDATAYRFLSTFDPTNQNEPLFTGPEGIAISDLGIVYVADTGNNAIRGIRTEGNVTTVFDLYGNPGSSNLKSPRGIFFTGSSSDPVNNPPALFVLDSANYSVKKLYLNELDGSLDTSKGDPEPFPTFPNQRTGCEKIAGLSQTPGWQGVPVSAADAKFYSPRGLIYTTDPVTGSETIYLADTVNHVIRQITKTNNAWTARTVVGLVGAKGNVNAVGNESRLGTASRLNYPVGLALDEDNQVLYFTEFGNHSLRRVYLPFNSRIVPDTTPVRTMPPWTVDLVAGSGFYGPTLFGPNGPQGTGNGDGLGAAAVFYYPAGISFNKADGSILLADTNNHVLRKIAIATTGPNAWIGNSTAFAGSVGVAGNRDFSDLPEFTYRWKKDALLMNDNAPAAVSSISGSRTDTLAVSNIQYEDAGVYALVVTNAFEEVIETAQSFVYVATEGDYPKFLSPGYRVESPSAPGIPLVDPQRGSDIHIFADVLPADQVTYQWQVKEDVPGENAEDGWIALSDRPLSLQTELHKLLGNSNGSTISGSTTSRLAIGKLQVSLITDKPPKLRFRVEAKAKAVPPLDVETKMETITLQANWSVSAPQTVTVDYADGLSVGMFLVGPGIKSNSKITAIDTTNPSAIVLTIDEQAERPGTNVQISGAVDLAGGTGLSIRYPVIVTNKGLSLQLGTGSETQLANLETVRVANAASLVLRLSAGTSAALGNPDPVYQWYKKDSVSGTPVAISGATQTTYSIPSVQDSDRGYYFVTVSNGVGASDDSNSFFLDVERPPSLSILSMSLDGGSLTQNTGSRQERVVDKTKSPALSLTANVDASAQPDYTWTFQPDDPSSPATDISKVGVGGPPDNQRTFGQLSFSSFSDDADGVFTLTVTVPASGGAPSVTRTCSWHVTVKYLPQYVPDSKVFLVGTQNVSQDAFTVDLNENNSVDLKAEFKSPRTLPLTYRWRRDKIILASTTNSLRLDRVTKTDIGTYKLEVTNALGTLVFGPTTGSEVPFPGTPAPAGWKLMASGKPSVVIQPNGKPLVSTNTNISAALAGTVASAPRAAAIRGADLSAPIVQRIARGQRMALQVAVDADPAPTYQWYRARNDNTFFETIAGARSAIYVLPTATDPVGTRWKYYVVATNPLGSVQSDEIVVRVEGLPDPVISATAIASPAWQGAPAPFPNGSVVILSAAVSDTLAQYAYQWRVNGNAILGATSKELTLPNIESGQAGAYSVLVTGVAGSRESARYTVAVTQGSSVPRYFVTVDGADELRALMVTPSPTSAGMAAGTRVALGGVAPFTKILQSWRVEYYDGNGEYIRELLPARNAQFVMPAADVTVTPILSRPYTGNYTGLLSLDAPWHTEDGAEWATEDDIFRPTGVEPSLGNIRGFFTSTVTASGAVSGQILLENKTYSFTTVLDAEMRAKFRIVTSLKGVAWSMNGTLAFNPTEENRQQGYVDNVMHVVLKDALLATPPLVQVGQTLYCSAAGYSGAADALREDVVEGLFNSQFAAAPFAQGAAAAADSFSAIPVGTAAAAADAVAAPRVTNQPTAISTGTGGVAIFYVGVAPGIGTTRYQWFKSRTDSTNGGTEISGGTQFLGQTSTILTISNLQKADEGYYYLRITPASGPPVFSNTAQLLVVTNPVTGVTGTPGQLSGPMDFTAAVYRETNGETKDNSFGQAAVLSARIRFGTGATIVQGYLANGTRVTFSTFLGRAFTTPQLEGPGGVGIDPSIPAARPFVPTAALLSGQAAEALSETLLRKSSSQSIALWFRGDTATEPLVGTMIFNGPKVYGSFGALNLNTSTKMSEYTPNALAGYFYDPLAPNFANLTTTPLGTVDATTGLIFGGFLEPTGKYVQTNPPYSPAFAGFKSSLACTTAGVVMQKPDILPGYPWTPGSLGGYVGFIYRGKNATFEPFRNVLGNGTPETATHPTTGVKTGRIEPFRINLTDPSN